MCFEFYDVSTGIDIGNVVCKNIFKVDMNASFLHGEDKFPRFVLDITYGKLDGLEIIKSFKELTILSKTLMNQ